MFYPNISEDMVATIRLAQDFLRKNGDGWLDAKECRYSGAVKDFLRESVVLDVDVENMADDVWEDEPEELDKQIQKIIRNLNVMEAQIGGLEPNEKLQLFKTKTALVEKLITMREKVNNLKELNEFRAIVIKGLEEICSEEQIAEFMERLK